LLRRYPQAVVETVEQLPVVDAPGLASDGERLYDPGVRHAYRLWPHLYHTSGFFAARIRKNASIDVEAEPQPVASWQKSGFAPLPPADQALIGRLLSDSFGFDLNGVVVDRALTLWAREKLVFAMPERVITRFGSLPHVAAGLMIGQWAGGEFTPSHELITRFDAQFPGSRCPVPDETGAIWLAGRDLRGLDVPYPPGSVILLEDSRGRFIGRGKVQPNRIRNLLPKRLTYS